MFYEFSYSSLRVRFIFKEIFVICPIFINFLYLIDVISWQGKI